MKEADKKGFVDDGTGLEDLTGAGERKARRYRNQVALAMELPFTFVGAVILGGLLGYFLDRWLHTKMIFTLVFGGVGFYAGLREVLRRLDGSKGS